MTVLNKIYLKKSGVNAYYDMELDYGSITSNGQSYTFVGTRSVEAIYVRPGMSVDFRNSLGGADRVYLEGLVSEYSFQLSADSVLLTVSRGSGATLESVTLSTLGTSTTADLLIFGDGSINASSVKQALIAASGSTAPPVLSLDSKVTSVTPVPPVVSDHMAPTAFATVYMGVGGQVKTQGPTVSLSIVGTRGVDVVYVTDGSQVDAKNLLGGQDQIYMRGAYEDYTKTLSSDGVLLTLTRDVVVDGVTVTEKVVVAAGTATSSDRLIFVDGSVTASEVKSVLGSDPGIALENINTYDGTMRTPGVVTVNSVEISGNLGGVGDGSGVTWLSTGDEIILTVSMSAGVAVDPAGGIPRIRLNVSGVAEGKEVFAVYDPARTLGYDDESKLAFVYTIENDLTPLGNVGIGSDAIQLNGGSIQDMNGSSVVLHHDSVAPATAYRIDAVAETVSASIQSFALQEASGVDNGYLKAGEFLGISAQMSEAVSFTASPKLALSIGGQKAFATYDHTSADGTEVFFTYEMLDPMDMAAIGVSGVTIYDVAGNSTAVVCEPLNPTHAWTTTTGWGAIDALGALNAITDQNFVDIQADSGVSWWQSACNINDLHHYGYTGKGIKIAVMDTGLNGGILDFAQRITDDSWNFVSNNSNVSDDNGHGTFVTSEIFAANNGMGLTGASYDSSLMVLKVLDKDGNGTASTVSDAICYAVDHGANVLNLSLGGGDYSGYATALQYAYDHNVLVVMASGNNGEIAWPLDPAAHAMEFSNCLAVGALQSLNGALTETGFSHQAGSSEPYGYVAAPGASINGYYQPSSSAIYTASGTSMAAPLVSSVAALLWSAAPDASASDIARVIYQTSHSVLA